MMPDQLHIRTEKYMTCNFDHFLLRFHMSVAIVGHLMGNMPMEVLNLGEKRYVE